MIVVIVVIVAAIWWIGKKNSGPTFVYAVASIDNVTERVSVTGTVSPIGKASLAFEKGGVITRIYVKVGDKVSKGQPIADLDSTSDSAAVASAEATLRDMSRNLTPEELAVQQANISAAQISLDNAKRDALNAFHDGYTKVQGAIVNSADYFFANPQSANPTITVRTDSSATQIAIDTEMVAVTNDLDTWYAELSTASTSNASNIMSAAMAHISPIKSFMNDLSNIVDALSPGNSSLAPNIINADVATMNSGLAALNSAIDSITAAQKDLSTAESAYAQAVSDYNLKLAGNSNDAIASQAAKVKQVKAILSQDFLLSPIDGTVTSVDPNVGEYVAPGQSGFTVQDNDFKIEAFVPEADIAKITLGELASSTLDAYGSYTDFPTQVTSIDPAETVLEGVPTYKVTLHFVRPDERIRSGMTVNLEILTHEADNVLMIPYRAVAISATSTTVQIVSTDGKSFSSIPVVTGLKGSDGTIQVISGLKPGDKVVTYVK